MRCVANQVYYFDSHIEKFHQVDDASHSPIWIHSVWIFPNDPFGEEDQNITYFKFQKVKLSLLFKKESKEPRKWVYCQKNTSFTLTAA